MGIFSKPPFNSDKKREFPEGLWQKCPACAEMIHNLELVQNFRVCPKCDYHFTQSARERLEMLLDPGSFEEHDAGMISVDTLKFTGMASYTERLKAYQKKTGLKDAVISGFGKIDDQPLGIAVMDFNFIAVWKARRSGASRWSSSPPPAARGCTRECSASCKWPRPPARSRCTRRRSCPTFR
jgi:acetyl-CoA carboxylase carboxyl transferase subunit beta